jgi:hypothetical protein
MSEFMLDVTPVSEATRTPNNSLGAIVVEI